MLSRCLSFDYRLRNTCPGGRCQGDQERSALRSHRPDVLREDERIFTCNPILIRLSLRVGVVRSRWASWSSKPVVGRVASRGGFDSHPLSPTLICHSEPRSGEESLPRQTRLFGRNKRSLRVTCWYLSCDKGTSCPVPKSNFLTLR